MQARSVLRSLAFGRLMVVAVMDSTLALSA